MDVVGAVTFFAVVLHPREPPTQHRGVLVGFEAIAYRSIWP